MHISENWQESLEANPSLNKAEDCAVNLQLFSGFFLFFFKSASRLFLQPTEVYDAYLFITRTKL